MPKNALIFLKNCRNRLSVEGSALDPVYVTLLYCYNFL